MIEQASTGGAFALDEMDTELKGVTDQIVEMIGELSQ